MSSWDWIKGVMRGLTLTREEEYSCDEANRLIDQYAEMVARGEDPSALLPLVRRHLDFCPDCREEYEVLLRILVVNK
jgi:hypothetical protein